MDRRLKRIRMELCQLHVRLARESACEMLQTAGPGCIAGDLVEIRRLGAAIHAVV
jgi:hypothetical protein